MAEATYTPLEMIDRLVAFDTTSRNSNLELIDFVDDYLAGHGVASTRTFDDGGGKANLFASLGPDEPGGVVLSGHTDVVPVDGQPWDTDPFSVVRANGRLYGRGTSDMKSFIAIALALVPAFQAHGLAVPLHLALSYDEEVGCLGVDHMIEGIAAAGIEPQIVVVGEPTGMHVANAHKGIYSFCTLVTGFEAHSSATHLGVNAVMTAAELIAFLGDLAVEMKDRAEPDSEFEPPYTTVHVGTIEGGTALNIIPRECRFQWEYRLIPDADEDEIINRFNEFSESLEQNMKAISSNTGIETTARSRVPGLEPEAASPAERLIMTLTGDNQALKVSYATEAGKFQRSGASTVICGPGHITQAHKPNEYIDIAQVEACEAFMHRLMDRLRQSL
ncbi:MAG: acetylornithine deacetylase [Pseudomonadota bacterium]|nr:acetylornithine deacetylase [Pseudomonadota bacterium]